MGDSEQLQNNLCETTTAIERFILQQRKQQEQDQFNEIIQLLEAKIKSMQARLERLKRRRAEAAARTTVYSCDDTPVSRFGI